MTLLQQSHSEVGAGTCQKQGTYARPKINNKTNMGGEEDLKQNFPFWVEVYALEVKDNSSVAHGGQ